MRLNGEDKCHSFYAFNSVLIHSDHPSKHISKKPQILKLLTHPKFGGPLSRKLGLTPIPLSPQSLLGERLLTRLLKSLIISPVHLLLHLLDFRFYL